MTLDVSKPAIILKGTLVSLTQSTEVRELLYIFRCLVSKARYTVCEFCTLRNCKTYGGL